MVVEERGSLNQLFGSRKRIQSVGPIRYTNVKLAK